MANTPRNRASFGTQANALLRKNLTFQKRKVMTNCRLISFPFVLCMLLSLIQALINKGQSTPEDKDSNCLSNPNKVGCPAPRLPEWPPLLQIPLTEYRAVKTNVLPFTDLPDESCRSVKGSCPVTVLMTGSNQSLGEILAGNMFSNSLSLRPSNYTDMVDNYVLGVDGDADLNNISPVLDGNMYYIQPKCLNDSNALIQFPALDNMQTLTCAQALNLWRNSSSEVNKELYQGYSQGNSEGKINEILAAYDFLNSDHKTFNLSIWYNATSKDNNMGISFLSVPATVNLASNAYLKFVKGPGAQILLELIKGMYQPVANGNIDIASLLGTIFFTWVVLQLFPVVMTSLVYEKQQNLRIMMKMHGLGDGPYWLITYMYFLFISTLYMVVFVIFGVVIGLKFFSTNAYSIQCVFYFMYINLQISVAFVMSTLFSNVKTATVVGYISVFGTGLLGAFLFQNFIEDSQFPGVWIIVMELYPGFALFRGLYEFGQYSMNANLAGIGGMKWENLDDPENGMKNVLIIMFLEWLLSLFLTYYMDQVFGSGKSPLFFLQNSTKKNSLSLRMQSMQRQGSEVVNMEKPDVAREREKVERLLLEPSASHGIVCHDLRKVYPGRDGNPKKVAVKGLSLALPRAECFGMLGPNGAGKTSFISMMIGLTKPTSGSAYISGLDLQTQMDCIYTCIGVCPQYDLLWESLTGREHLLFYGRLKNLKGSALNQAVEESLKSVNLFNGGVPDKQAGKYSGGMKRRLSVAIALIGDPRVVYMDEPSTGLDPASRNSLWNVVKRAKQDRAILLTTHSMEEAEALCDRLGIFADGSLQCVGNPKELKARYGGSYVFSMTTTEEHEKEVMKMIRHLSPNAERTYHISGTQKFEIPKHEVRIADVFHAVENAKSRFPVFAWGFSDTTLEDVFIKVAKAVIVH
ncbi:hypothetical protein K2173_004960 [Erythroxylum novogranatense]|uniref:ABC transporter domain-containing protein n=1 Tax=Erythroxylum novogranatense TaxID=1862640 RepID=A0AAV8TB68_9ROSI|nr:hypothetical protein K2173_004960 [Erythroxylum novogranatense]